MDINKLWQDFAQRENASTASTATSYYAEAMQQAFGGAHRAAQEEQWRARYGRNPKALLAQRTKCPACDEVLWVWEKLQEFRCVCGHTLSRVAA